MTHELDVTKYSLCELFALFNMHPETANITELRNAKKIVLYTHPDKSRLPSAYFLFYKKAYDIVYELVAERIKIDTPVTNATATALRAVPVSTEIDYRVKHAIDSVPTAEFSKTFNRMYESSVIPTRQVRDNSWFSDESIDNAFNASVSNANGISNAIEKIRTSTTELRKNSNTIIATSALSSALCSGDAYDINDVNDDSYIYSDVFSRLKYDDLRKVHKDHTIFAVSESQYVHNANPAPREQNITPMCETDARNELSANEIKRSRAMLEKAYNSKLQGMRNETIQNSALSQFLRLT